MAIASEMDSCRPSASVVSDVEVATFRREGFVRINLRKILGDEAIDGLRAAYDRAEAAKFAEHTDSPWNDSPQNALLSLHYMYRHHPECATVSLSPRIGELAARLAGVQHMRLFYDQVMIKMPGMAATPWHQDMPFLPFSRRGHMAIWIAIDDHEESMGLMRYVPRSHKIGSLPRALPYDPKKLHLLSDEEILRGRPSDDVKSMLREDDLEVVGDVVTLKLRSGEAVVHDGMLLHSAATNTSGRSRRAHQLTLIPADTQYTGMPFPDTDGLGLIPFEEFNHPNFPIIY